MKIRKNSNKKFLLCCKQAVNIYTELHVWPRVIIPCILTYSNEVPQPLVVYEDLYWAVYIETHSVRPWPVYIPLISWQRRWSWWRGHIMQICCRCSKALRKADLRTIIISSTYGYSLRLQLPLSNLITCYYDTLH